MNIFALKDRSTTSHSKRIHFGPSLITSSAQSVHPTANVPLIQKKCVCGGGCPLCIGSHTLQAKLTIGRSDDKYEQEADQVADQVMRMPHPLVQRNPTSGANGPPCEDREFLQTKRLSDQIEPLIKRQTDREEEKPTTKSIDNAAMIQRQPMEDKEEEELFQAKSSKGQNQEPKAISAAQLQAVESTGHPLTAATCGFFEPRLGYNLGKVRVHTCDSAIQMNQSLNARAFTYRNHIFFNRGQYSPETFAGKRLLGHELAHVRQQNENMIRLFSCNPSPSCSVWGGFRICGSSSFRRTVLGQLETLNGTTQGRGVLDAVEENRRPWYRSLIRIEESSSCGFLPVRVLFNATGCNVTHRCPGASSEWQRVPNHVYLFHEIVHVYEYLIGGRGTHSDRECMATGLGSYFASIPYNENKLRCELALPVRPCYDGYCTGHAAPVCPNAEASAGSAVVQREKEEEKHSQQLGMKVVEYPDGKKSIEVAEEWQEGGGIASTYIGMARAAGVSVDVVANALMDSGHYKSLWHVKFRLIIGTRIIVDKGKINSVSVRRAVRRRTEDKWEPFILPRSVNFYRGRFRGKSACMGLSDPAENFMCQSAIARKKKGLTQVAEPIQKIEDIFNTLDSIAKSYEQSSGRTPGPFISELQIHGHGDIGSFRFGKKYTLSDLKRYKTGRLQAYLKQGSTIYLEGCLVAQNEPFLCEVGRIMFGSTKGIIWGSKSKVPAWPRLKPLELDTKKIDYPMDCNKKVNAPASK